MNDTNQPWKRLVALARQAPLDRDDTAPSGFATRVLAQATVKKSAAGSWAILERLAFRGVFVAATCCVAAVAFNYFGASADVSYDSYLDETVSEMLDLS